MEMTTTTTTDHGQYWPQRTLGMEAGSIRPVTAAAAAAGQVLTRRPRPQKEEALNCPRCNSTNTKFCYYNNYSLSQPRFFCKGCRRYWTQGGTLRNVPVGGGSRKHKRYSSSSSSSASSNVKPPPPPPPPPPHDHDHLHLMMTPPSFSHHQSSFQNQKQNQNPKMMNIITSSSDGCQDLNLAYGHPHPPSSSTTMMMSSTCFMPPMMSVAGMMNTIYSSSRSSSSTTAGFPLQILDQFKPSLNFTLDGFQSGTGGGSGFAHALGLQGAHDQENNMIRSSARVFFPFEDLKQQQQQEAITRAADDQFEEIHRSGKGEPTTGYWSSSGGMLGGGGGSW